MPITSLKTAKILLGFHIRRVNASLLVNFIFAFDRSYLSTITELMKEQMCE